MLLKSNRMHGVPLLNITLQTFVWPFHKAEKRTIVEMGLHYELIHRLVYIYNVFMRIYILAPNLSVCVLSLVNQGFRRL